jgi:hypothetical protein
LAISPDVTKTNVDIAGIRGDSGSINDVRGGEMMGGAGKEKYPISTSLPHPAN